ncbi:MAG: type I methionyl aminopeptidase [Candidatus Omnitrophica bacterium]|nr:type I methionyl aminopeptidase [Candidatus Omnitrophota bacterium]
MIPLKSEKDLEMLKIAGRILSRVMQRLRESVKAGISTVELDSLAWKLIESEQAIPAFKGYKGYPANICTSINEEIVHGIPSGRRLKEGDIISLDVGINYKGYFSDAAITLGIGRIDSGAKRLIDVTGGALSEGIRKARAGNYLSDISYAVQSYAEAAGFSVVREFVGHGIGNSLHEEPEIPNFGQPHQGPVIKNGMVFAIEPMVNAGTWRSRILENQWTAVTADGELSAHFEHTVAVTDKGPEILTA